MWSLRSLYFWNR